MSYIEKVRKVPILSLTKQQILSENKETNLPDNWIQVTQINPNMQIH